jgi:replicative DNA helicase
MRDPYSLEAENGVLGAMLIKPELIDMLSADLAEADFYWEANRETYRAILSLRAEGKAVDFLTVAERMGVNIAETAELQRNTPSAANAQEYSRIVKARSLDRSLINAAQTIHEIAHSDSATADKVSAAQAEVLAIDGTAASQEIIHAGDVMRAHIEELERREELKGAMDGLSTGLADLDAKINGLKPEQLIVVAGRAKMGKTTFAMGIARHNAIRANKQVLVISLEMSNAQIMDRLIAAEGGVPLGALKDGSATTEYSLQVTAAAGKIINSGLCLSERPGLTISRIRSMARRHKMVRGLDLLIIDHLGLIDAEDSSMNTLARVSEITRQSKLLARELKIPVILLSQLNRALEQRADRRPMPSDLRDSGTIEQDADLVFFVYRDEVYDPNSAHKGIAEIIVGIARDVEQCTVFTSYQGQYNRFMDLAQGQHIPELRTEKKVRGVSF